MPGHPNSAGDETMICTCQSRERIHHIAVALVRTRRACQDAIIVALENVAVILSGVVDDFGGSGARARVVGLG